MQESQRVGNAAPQLILASGFQIVLSLRDGGRRMFKLSGCYYDVRSPPCSQCNGPR